MRLFLSPLNKFISKKNATPKLKKKLTNLVQVNQIFILHCTVNYNATESSSLIINNNKSSQFSTYGLG